ncbi:MAG TPA: SRPBCC domain-containing protein [Vicinamibacterales bacterium]|nr:SRPBCC domain-containing protein [Vicinamibacterales bacterium]
MPDILHDFPIKAPVDRVFRAVSTPEGLATWWTKRSAGQPDEGAEYELWFGPDYDWRAKVTRCVADSEFELEMTRAGTDWTGTRVNLRLEPRGAGTWVRFSHTGWPSTNEHYRISCNCWAMYLRILRRSLEHGESVPYENRLDA